MECLATLVWALPLADFTLLAVTADPSGSVLKNVRVERVRNDDHGGVRVKGDGVRYCDMTGSGSDDYIVRGLYFNRELRNADKFKWLSVTGEVTVWGNIHSPGS